MPSVPPPYGKRLCSSGAIDYLIEVSVAGCFRGTSAPLGDLGPLRTQRAVAAAISCAVARSDALDDALPAVSLRHLVGIALELLGAVFRELRDCRLRGVPEPLAILIEVGRRRREPAQCITEHSR